jgi:hypothetical protein
MMLYDPPGPGMDMFPDEYSATMEANKRGLAEIWYYAGDGCYYLEKESEKNDG